MVTYLQESSCCKNEVEKRTRPSVAVPLDDHIDWTRADVLRLIDLYKQHECLWQVTDKDYTNRRVRRTSLNAVAKELSTTMRCVVRPEYVMKKMHTLRAQLRREVKAMKASQWSGAGTDVHTAPKLWCYNALTFLDDGILQDSSHDLHEQQTQVSS